jgi:hypothetical protein
MLRIEYNDHQAIANKREGMKLIGDPFDRDRRRAAVFAHFTEIRT